MGKRTYPTSTCNDCQRVRPILARGMCSTCYSYWHRRENGRLQQESLCDYCGMSFSSVSKGTRYCSLAHAQWDRRDATDVAVELWRPGIARHLDRARRSRFCEVNGPWSFFVYGPCAWCSEEFMAPAADWARRSLYCSKRCGRNVSRSRRGRFQVRPKVRLAIYERDGWICQLCRDPVDRELGVSDLWAATLDHVIPRSHTLFPDDSPENLQLAHRWCNSVKGDELWYTADDLRVA